jgi:hypothetical protein
MTSVEFHILPSFCNAWPLISVEVNGQDLWSNYVDHPQTVTVNFAAKEINCVRIKYLNKRKGPMIWDTIIDEHGKIVQDQNCVISEIKVGGSRCDFLLLDLLYYHEENGTTESGLYGFMSSLGYYEFEFPQDVYSWVSDQRKSRMLKNPKKNSSLDYWTNYMGDSPATDSLIVEIESLLDQL